MSHNAQFFCFGYDWPFYCVEQKKHHGVARRQALHCFQYMQPGQLFFQQRACCIRQVKGEVPILSITLVWAPFSPYSFRFPTMDGASLASLIDAHEDEAVSEVTCGMIKFTFDSFTNPAPRREAVNPLLLECVSP